MADVYTYINETGLVEVSAPEIQNQVSAEYTAAFGQDLVVPSVDNPQASSTPQGLLINAETLARIAVADNNAALANQINPNVAGGVFLDAIMYLTGSTRTPATQTIVTATLHGTPATLIPSGSLAAETASGNAYQFSLINNATIASNGYVTGVQFQAVLYGDIPCQTDSLTTIISNVIGWDSITDSIVYSLGAATQSDASARLTRNTQIAGQGSSTAGSIIAAVSKSFADNGGSGSVTFLENVANTTETIDGVSMVAHSIYVCISTSIPTAEINGTKSTVTATVAGTPTTIIDAGSQASETGSGYNNVFAVDANVPFNLDGTLTSSSTTINMASTAGVFPGQAVTGTGIPTSTTVSTVTTDTSIVVSHAATVSGLETLTFTSTSWVIPTGGSIDIPFSSFSTGQVPADVATLTTIVTPISGWDTVTNALSAVQGTPSPIAYAITSKKSAGSNYNNGSGTHVSALVIVPYSNQQINVLYDVATVVPIYMSITIKVITPVQDPVETVRLAISEYVMGNLTGIPGLVAGQNVSSFELAGAVTSQYPGIYVQSCFISRSPAPSSSAEIVIQKYEIAYINTETIPVSVV